ncbi:MAG TPA: sigma factor-like helix-turn-helix DNA-binding protein [Puia sp.]|nr:sigma factor-like helix-turn-helix DNA-binding protein [Puia sp.]
MEPARWQPNDETRTDSKKTAVQFPRGDTAPQTLHLRGGRGRDIQHAAHRHGESQTYFPDERTRTLPGPPANNTAAYGVEARPDTRGAVKELPGVHPHSFKPKCYLEKEFARLFDGLLRFYDLLDWQKKHFGPETLHRIMRIRKAVGRLTPRQKKVFFMTRYENRQRKEAAAELGLSLHVVNSELRLATKIVRKHIKIKLSQGL